MLNYSFFYCLISSKLQLYVNVWIHREPFGLCVINDLQQVTKYFSLERFSSSLTYNDLSTSPEGRQDRERDWGRPRLLMERTMWCCARVEGQGTGQGQIVVVSFVISFHGVSSYLPFYVLSVFNVA